jgi:hypothetical protein
MIVDWRGFAASPRVWCHVLAQGQYDEFKEQLDRLIVPLRAAAPQIVFRPYHVQGHGRPGVFAFGARTSLAKYQFQLSILIRWRDSAILSVLEGDEVERETARANFASNVHGILRDIESRYRVDWRGGSQDSPQGLTIELEEFWSPPGRA